MQNVNKGHSTRKRGKRTPVTTKPTSGPVTTVKIDPALWRQRLGHDAERLLWVDAVTLMICNSRKHRDYMRKVLADA